MGKFNSTPAT